MKKNYLYGIMILALTITACEPAEETFTTQQPAGTAFHTKNMPAASATGDADYILLYRTLLNGFEPLDIDEQDKTIRQFEEYALSNGAFQNIMPGDYENIQLSKVFEIMSANEDFIDSLDYTDGVKQLILDIIERTISPEQILDNADIDENETEMLVTLYKLHNEGNGNDDRWKVNRAIAFAYGGQNSTAEGLIYAGVIEILNTY